MRRPRVAVLIGAAIAVAVVATLAPGIAIAQSPTPSPTGTPSPTTSPSPSPTESTPTPTPSCPTPPTPTPTPSSPTPTATQPSDEPTSPTGIAAVVDIQVNTPGGLAEIGERLSYSLLVVNPTDAPLQDLTITNVVPEEMNVEGVPIVDHADAINLISTGSSEQIVWSLNELAAGESVTLPWEASVSATGDLVAQNDVTVQTRDASSTASRNVYLARSSAPVVQGAASAARPTVEKRQVVRYEQRRIPAGTAPAILPFTGANVAGWFLLALILIALGAALIRYRRSPIVLCGLMGLVVMAACTSADSPPSAGTDSTETAAPSDDSETEDEVLGTRIRRGDNESGTSETQEDEPQTNESEVEEPTDDEPAADLPLPQEDLIRVVEVPVVEVVEVQAPAPESLASLQGENLITFSWDESGRAVTGAASSRTITREPVASVLAELATGSPTIAPSVELVNLSEAPLVVRGELGVETLGPSGQGAVTTSKHIDAILAPGGSVALDFEYVLPSGDYSSVAFFRAD